jgi:predicted ABC-type sugar transport system permease subunit
VIFGGETVLHYFNSREVVIAASLILTVCGIVFIILTGRYELSLFVIAALLPWVEYWSKRKKR